MGQIDLDDVLAGNDARRVLELPQEALVRMFWKLKGLRKNLERDGAFWGSTNDNLRRAYEKLDEQERELARTYNIIREDLEVAEQVQRALLPKPDREMEAAFEVAVHHKQLTQVGGDYYDYFRTGSGRLAVGVFDISGHGASAALITSFLKAQFQHAMAAFDGPREIVERVNALSYDFLREVRRYATVNFVVFEDTSLRYVSGGGYGLLLRHGEAHSFAKQDPFLGLRKKPFHEHSLSFGPGDLLALYTDGIVEAQDAAGADYSVRRLNALIAGHAAEPVADIVARCVDDYQRFRAADSDDVTLLLLRRRPR